MKKFLLFYLFFLYFGETPVIDTIPDEIITEGSVYTGPTPTLSQGTWVTWSLDAGPSGMGIDGRTGVVSWSNPTASGSPHTITVEVTNFKGSDQERPLLLSLPPGLTYKSA